MNPDGDIAINDETLEGLGNKTLTFLKPFFGILFQIAQPTYPSSSQQFPPGTPANEEEELEAGIEDDYVFVADDDVEDLDTLPDSDSSKWHSIKPLLMSCVPSPGYFAAGGVAGIISRTATAPLDRLKVYLIAQTTDSRKTIEAAKKGAPLDALRGAWRTSASACRELWAAGGIRSLYAGNGRLLRRFVIQRFPI